MGVEADPNIWHLPKKLLTTNSTFFAAALDGGFAEQDSKTVTLPEVATDDFEVWIQWLYLGELFWPKAIERPELDYDKELVRLWSLGDMLGCPVFQDVLLRLLVKRSDNGYGMRPSFLAFVWETCAHGSKLRKFVVDQFITDVREGRFKRNPKIEEAFTQFVEDNEDFAREYTAASIRNGDCEPQQTLYENYARSPQAHITSS